MQKMCPHDWSEGGGGTACPAFSGGEAIPLHNQVDKLPGIASLPITIGTQGSSAFGRGTAQ